MKKLTLKLTILSLILSFSLPALSLAAKNPRKDDIFGLYYKVYSSSFGIISAGFNLTETIRIGGGYGSTAGAKVKVWDAEFKFLPVKTFFSPYFGAGALGASASIGGESFSSAAPKVVAGLDFTTFFGLNLGGGVEALFGNGSIVVGMGYLGWWF